MRFYQMNAELLARQLDSDINNGLSDHPAEKQKHYLKPLIRNVAETVRSTRSKWSPLWLLPLVFYFLALVFSVLNHQWSLLYLTILVFFAMIALFAAEEQVLASLKKKHLARISAAERSTIVVRSGKELCISADELMVGDLIRLNEGSILYGDARILCCENLLAVETAVFNTNIPAVKRAEAIEQENLPPEKQDNMLWKGSYIHSGNGMAMIIALGEDCYIEKTGGRTKRKHRSVFYRRQNNIGRWVTFLFSALAFLLLLIAAFITGRYVEVFIAIAAVTSLVMVNPISALTEWTYYRTAERFYKKGVLIRNFQAFDSMRQEQDVYFDIKSLLKENLVYLQTVSVEKSEKECLTYFALCNEGTLLAHAVYKPLNQFGIGTKWLEESLVGSRRSNDPNGNACGIFMNGTRTVAAVSGYWKNMATYLEPLEETLIQYIDELEKHGNWVCLVAGRSTEDPISFPMHGFKIFGLVVFNVQIDGAFLDAAHQLRRAGASTHLANSYSENFGVSIAAAYDIDNAVHKLAESEIAAVTVDALPIEKEEADIVYKDLEAYTSAVYQTKCMFCGIKRAMCFIGLYGLFMVFTVFAMILGQLPIAAVVIPIVMVRIVLMAPCYFLIESARNCNQFKRSIVLGLFCGVAGFFAALMKLDMALLSMQVSALFLAIYLWMANRKHIPFANKTAIFLGLLLLAVLFPWFFMAGNCSAMLLIALFVPASAFILDLFY